MKKRILIIDDDIELCILLSRFLSRNGYDVEEASSGVKGIQKFKHGSFDIVICDYQLGDIEGLEVLQEIKAMNPGTIVFIITGYSDIKTAVNAMRSGAYDYITKPLVPDEILNMLNAVNKDSANVNQAGERSKKVYEERTSYEGESIGLYKHLEHVARPGYGLIQYGEGGLR